MWETSERLLRLLALLQRSRSWNADQLATELAVTERTVRRDVSRLRDLGYPVAALHGAGGGYELEAGAALPPLMFDAGEAVSTMLALQSAAARGNQDEVLDALSALDKIYSVMPPRLRTSLDALANHSSTIELGEVIGAPPGTTAIDALLVLARACRSRHQVTCVYEHHSGASELRRLEPLHLVSTMNRWYLVAFSTESGEWRTYRVDRITEMVMTSTPSYPRKPPADDLRQYVSRQVGAGIQQVTGTVRVHAPMREVAHWILPAWGTITPESAEASIVSAGADSYDAMARWLLLLDKPITVLQPPELCDAFANLSTVAGNIATGIGTSRPKK